MSLLQIWVLRVLSFEAGLRSYFPLHQFPRKRPPRVHRRSFHISRFQELGNFKCLPRIQFSYLRFRCNISTRLPLCFVLRQVLTRNPMAFSCRPRRNSPFHAFHCRGPGRIDLRLQIRTPPLGMLFCRSLFRNQGRAERISCTTLIWRNRAGLQVFRHATRQTARFTALSTGVPASIDKF